MVNVKIGIDVDGVLTNLEEYQLKYGKKYFKNVNNVNEKGYDICEIFHCTKEEEKKFWTKYIWKYCLIEPIVKDAKKVIDNLKKDGHDIYIITSRAHTTEENALGSLFRKMLETWLRKNGIIYDGIYYCSESQGSNEKYQICKDLGIDIMIEDNEENINKIKEIATVICINAKYNQSDLGNTVLRIDNFSQVYDILHQENHEDKEIDEVEKFDKDRHRNGYIIARNIGTPVFKLLLKPTIINKQYIPKQGPLILCGNHLHVWDQFPVICSTNRVTHWMSKKEYFDGKMGLFFEKTGAICVDRYGDAHKSFDEALNYLEIGSAVGLFPEGTRNHLKMQKIQEIYNEIEPFISEEAFITRLKEQNPLLSQFEVLYKLYKNGDISKQEFTHSLFHIDYFLKCNLSQEEYEDSLLLPFKYGAVSMAQKTNAIIVPFAVTGDYEIGNDNLMVRFGEGFTVGDMPLEDANCELRSKVLTLLKENKKM